MMVMMIGVSLEIFTAVMFQAEVFWVVTPCNIVVRYQRFGDPYSLQDPQDGGSMDLRNVGILPQHYTASQLRRPRLIS